MRTVWVIMWRYSDNSDFGVIERAWASEEEARWQAKVLADHGDKVFSLHSLELV